MNRLSKLYSDKRQEEQKIVDQLDNVITWVVNLESIAWSLTLHVNPSFDLTTIPADSPFIIYVDTAFTSPYS